MTFFNETAFLFGVMHCENSEVRNETCFGSGNFYKDLFSIYLQPSVNKNFVKPGSFDFAI